MPDETPGVKEVVEAQPVSQASVDLAPTEGGKVGQISLAAALAEQKVSDPVDADESTQDADPSLNTELAEPDTPVQEKSEAKLDGRETIPYDRFQEAINERNALKDQLAAAQDLIAYKDPLAQMLQQAKALGMTPEQWVANIQAEQAQNEQAMIVKQVDDAVAAHQKSIEDAGGYLDEATKARLEQAEFRNARAEMLVSKAEQAQKAAEIAASANAQREAAEARFTEFVTSFKGNEDMVPESIHLKIKAALLEAAPEHQAALTAFFSEIVRDIGNSVRASYAVKKQEIADGNDPIQTNGNAHMSTMTPQSREQTMKELKGSRGIADFFPGSRRN